MYCKTKCAFFRGYGKCVDYVLSFNFFLWFQTVDKFRGLRLCILVIVSKLDIVYCASLASFMKKVPRVWYCEKKKRNKRMICCFNISVSMNKCLLFLKLYPENFGQRFKLSLHAQTYSENITTQLTIPQQAVSP